ncbi:MAG: HupE/UreJ family protein [Gammaproteobacteria bacterium]|nr:HupE/UreJ family protein [Gammaproteobacteria bacterium]
MRKEIMKGLAVVTLLMAAPLAEAHTGLSQNSFFSGLSHPLLGLDHLLAMLAVGLWAGKMGGRARWGLPLMFIFTLSLSAMAAQNFASLQLVDHGIAVSLLLLGLLLVFTIKLPVLLGLLAVSFFAVFHGVAHGTEWPVAASPFLYVSGFIATTVLIMGIGVTAGAAREEKIQFFIRVTGMLIASMGSWMILAN